MASTMPKCRICQGWGNTVVKSDGLCDHCRRTSAQVQPVAGQKRARSEDVKRAREVTMDEDELRRMLEAADAVDMPELDSTGIKKMMLTIERRITANLQQRSKHADDPKQYLDSEVQLDQSIKALQALAAVPEHYSTLVQSDTLGSLLGLLAHENTDIAIDVLQLLNELLKDDAIGDAPEAGEALARALLDARAPDMLVAALGRLNDDTNGDDAAGMFACIELFLSLIDILGPQATLPLCSVEVKDGKSAGTTAPALLTFVLSRIAKKDMDDVKGVCAELLAVCMSGDERNAALLGGGTFAFTSTKGARVQVDGVEYLLQIVNTYKKKAPEALSSAEKEVVENLMDALCSALLIPANQARFLAAEGFELLLRAVHENGFARSASLRAVDYALANNKEGVLAFIAASGLKAAFPAFMGKGLAQTKRWHGSEEAEAEEERSVSTIAVCLQMVAPPRLSSDLHVGNEGATDATSFTVLARVLSKFAESKCEKIDRLLELRAKYSSKVSAARDDEEEVDEDGEDDRYIKRIGAGLFTLQRIDLTLARLLTLSVRIPGSTSAGTAAAVSASKAVGHTGIEIQELPLLANDLAFTTRSKLYEQGASIVSVMETLQEYVERLDPSEGAGAQNGPQNGSGTHSERPEVEWMLSTLAVLGGLAEQ